MDMIRKEKIERIGQVGEKIIRNYLNRLKNVTVEDSLNVFDSQKDAVIEIELDEDDNESAHFRAKYTNEDGKTVIIKHVEIKTCTPFVTKKVLTIRENQLKKCRRVDELYFVTVPHRDFWFKYSGWILKLDPKKFNAELKPQSDSKEPGGSRMMYHIPVSQEATTRIRQLYKSELRELLRFSTQNLSQQDIEEMVEEYGIDDPIKKVI